MFVQGVTATPNPVTAGQLARLIADIGGFMAAPVIGSMTASPNPAITGQTVTLTILASDPDDRTVTINVTVTDAAGNVASGSTVLDVNDPLTYGVSSVPALVWTQNPTDPRVFTATV